MTKPALDPEERIFTLSDVKRLFLSQRARLIRWALIGGTLSFLYCAMKAPKYRVEATFKEEMEGKGGGGDALIKSFLGGGGAATQPQATALMKSFQVLRPLVQKMGLQANVPQSEWAVSKIFRRLNENWRIERKKGIADPDPFVFEDVFYEGENSLDFFIRFTQADHFIVYLPDRKTEISKGSLGESIHLSDAKFTLTKTPKTLKVGSFYPLQITPWISAVQSVRGQLKIQSEASNLSLLQLSFQGRDRYFGTRLLNELMSQYQCYLKRDHDQLMSAQLAYLEQKQGQIYSKLSDLFQEHVDYLTCNMKEKGFFFIEQESENMLRPHQDLQNKIMQIEIDLSRIDQMEKEGKLISGGSSFSDEFNQIFHRINDLKQQRDLLELSFQSQFVEQSLESRREELKEIRHERDAVEKFIEEVDRGQEISSFGLDEGLALWAERLQEPEEREDLAEYLEKYARLLSVREKMYQERFFYGDASASELEGIDLATARTLFIQYNGKFDEAEASMSHFETLKKEMERTDFELGSLSSILNDSLSQKLIEDACKTVLQLKDEKNHSSREGERWQNELALQKKILSDHLEQLYKVEKLNASLIREKMSKLQQISLDCINRQISVLYEQANDQLKALRQTLTQEKILFEKKMEELRQLAAYLPEKWRMEKWLELKSTMETGMITNMTELIESKTIGHHLHHVQSKPLDIAILPGAPLTPSLFKKALCGALLFAFAAFFIILIRQILRGFPTSLEKLRALRFPLLGSISAFCDGPAVETPTGPDLELLRQLALFAEGGKVIGLIGGHGPDYSYALGENIARMSAKSIVLRCDFLSKFRKEDTPGLLQIWKGEIGELPIRKGKGFDYITAGGYSPFGTEIIQSRSFQQLLELLKKNYDWVFLLFRTPLASAESTAALRLCDKAVVTVTDEQTEELTPFATWGYHENRSRLTFIHRS